MKAIILIFLALSISSCQTKNMQGQLVTNQDIQEINNTHPDKQKLTEMLGSPTYIPSHANNVWYYISRSSATQPFGPTKLLEQRIVKVEFINNKVSKAILVDNLQSKNIVTNKSATETYGSNKGVARKFVDNLGRFRVPPKKKNKK